MLSDPVHVAFDIALVTVALIGVFVFIVFERPALAIALMLYIAIVWAVELTFIAGGARAAGLLALWHPIFAVSTAVAALGIMLLRRARRSS